MPKGLVTIARKTAAMYTIVTESLLGQCEDTTQPKVSFGVSLLTQKACYNYYYGGILA